MALKTQVGAKDATTSHTKRRPGRFIRSVVLTTALFVPLALNAQLKQVGSPGDTISNVGSHLGVKAVRFFYEYTKKNAGQEPASLVYVGTFSIEVPIARYIRLKINDSITLSSDDLKVLRKEKLFENNKYVVFLSQQVMDGVVLPGLITLFKKKE